MGKAPFPVLVVGDGFTNSKGRIGPSHKFPCSKYKSERSAVSQTKASAVEKLSGNPAAIFWTQAIMMSPPCTQGQGGALGGCLL